MKPNVEPTLLIPVRSEHRNEEILKCQRVQLLTPRDFTLPHVRVTSRITKTHEPPRTKGSFRAPALHLLLRLRGGGKESQSEVLEIFKLHMRGIKL